MYRTFALSLIGLLAISGSSLMAQNYTVSTGTGVVPYYGWGGFGFHASTAAEGYLRGRAAVIDAAGSYNANTAQAAISYEQARSLALENDRQYVQNYFQRKELNRQYREALGTRPPSSEDLAQQAKDAAPDRLNKYQLDPVFGTINWPAALQGSEFAEYREAVERSFRHRDALNSGMGSRVQQTVAVTTDEMEATLKTQIRALSPMEYIQAKNFLQSLAYEAKFSPPIQGVAAITP